MKYQLSFACFALFAAAPAIAQTTGVPPGPPAVEIAGTVDTNVVNTVDANVVNTVDTNVVNTISAESLAGVDFWSSLPTGSSVIVVGTAGNKLRGMTTSIASVAPGEICVVSVSVRQSDGDEEELGFSVMSNGQAQSVSRNYEIPITLTASSSLEWEIDGNATQGCWLSLSMTAETSSEAEAARQLSGAQPMQIEIR
jgi:hypothetical protein